MFFGLRSAHLLPLALLPSLGEWLIIGVFGTLLFGRWMRNIPAVRNVLKEQPRTRESQLDRIRKNQTLICICIAAICLLVSFDLLRESRYQQGIMLLLCSLAAGMLAFAVHSK